MTCDIQDRLIELNALFKESGDIIGNLQQRLKERLSQTISQSDLNNAFRYCQDRVTIFRHLVETNFDSEKAYQQLYDTAHWRISNQVDQLTWRFFPEWFEEGFAFYHKYDRWGQPVLVVRLRHFPVDFIRQQQQAQEESSGDCNKKATLEYLVQPFVCYMLEIARRLTYDETCRKERQQQQNGCSDGPMLLPLVIEFNVVIDLVDAPYIPIDASFVELLSHLVQCRFPFMVGNISVLNFSWLHQGLWQVLKLLLSDDTKDRITFVTGDHLLQSIPKENLLQELGGSDDCTWNIQFKKVLQKFDTMLQYDILSSPPLSSTAMELPETSLFHDTDDTTRLDDKSSQYKDENEKCDMKDPVDGPLKQSLGQFGVAMQRRQLGLRMGYPFLSSYLIDQLTAPNGSKSSKIVDKEYEANQVMVTSLVENTHQGLVMEGSTQTQTQAEDAFSILTSDADDYRQKHSFSSLLRRSLCWLILYVFLRIPLESLIYRHLAPFVDPQHLLSSTIGLTTGMAMIMGTLIQVVDF
ncbi:CRAL-TRIO domain-containing protein [Absidia repens]|uniref:CRAL-TRIO domain-containing protein n=1 Tax=Absidia repens TaxID=90262 RepID=A0A1X2HZE5_9FUNG|nr:CRAL-TRIO domain-containing protein [Absidia repens]